MSLETPSAPWWARFTPIASWLPRYQRGWLPGDLLAGLALWAVMVPEAMAYAGIVGVPPIMGLYSRRGTQWPWHPCSYEPHICAKEHS